jgi:hypothetical protein
MKLTPFLAVAAAVLIASCGGSNDALDGPSGPALGGSAGAAGNAGGGTGGAGGTSEPEDGGDSGKDASNPDAPPGKTAEEACKAYSGAYCSQLDKCSAIYLQLIWKDAAACEASLVPVCVKALGLSDTAKTPAFTASCGEALALLDCSSFMSRKIPTACNPPAGPRADGAACGDDGQCANGYCDMPLDQACGTCATRAAADQGCDRDDDCAFGLICSKDNKCTPYVAKSGECDDNHPCEPGLSCKGAVGPKKGACADPAGPGQPCDTQQVALPGCDLNVGYFCHLVTHVCQKMDLSQAGESCGVVNNGYSACTQSSMCKTNGGMSGTCLAPASVGEACDLVNGPYCVPALRCVGNLCTELDPAGCK